MTTTVKRVALAYSGGLDTSISISWLKEKYDCEVVEIAGDVAQAEEFAGLNSITSIVRFGSRRRRKRPSLLRPSSIADIDP